ncbi:hypothetical protein [Dictyobacter kobayashii]|uniref:hypothetical protein n=1 Tax=Dictyobacter kobayashii TaxID=2014872 RepID=UPI001386ECBA|nr:hypothetical protein [Dictyobacter kobayashii]
MLRTRMSHRKFMLFGCVMLLAIWLAACGGSSASGTATTAARLALIHLIVVIAM